MPLSTIVTDSIADANITSAKIASSSVTSAKIADAGVTTAKIADANITTAKIADANVTTAKIESTITGAVRGTVTTDNDGSFNMNVTNNFKCTPTGAFALTFTNITAGQSGYVLLVNSGGYAVTAAATTKVGATFLSGVSAAGTYLISYLSDGTNVYCTASGALS